VGVGKVKKHRRQWIPILLDPKPGLFHPTHAPHIEQNANPQPPYAEKEKLGRGRWSAQNLPLLGRLRGIMARMGRKMKLRLLVLFLLLLSVVTFYNSRE
jgi:hypothetical protein